jgi:uncharacterized protein
LIPLLVSVLGASVLGSLHCAAMCGGFVCAVSAQGRPLASQVVWHAGRGFVYLVLGAFAGLLGAGFEHGLVSLGLPHAAAVVAGVLLVMSGLVALARVAGLRGLPEASASPFARVLGEGLRRVRDWPLLPRGFAMGAMTGLLPCGWLWAFVATAAGTGHADSGVVVMLAFWVGTLPALAAVGLAAGRVLQPMRARLPLMTALAMIVVGLLSIAGRLTMHTGHEAATGAPGHCAHLTASAAAVSGGAHVGR